MTYESADQAFEALRRGFYLESAEKGEPIPLLSDHHTEGVIAPIYSSRERADQTATRLAAEYDQAINVKPVTGHWDTLLKLARHGIAGVMLDEKHPVFFHNRLRDMNRSLPTLGSIRVQEGEHQQLLSEGMRELYFGTRGKLEVNKHELLQWRNYRAMDAMSVRWMLGDNPLPESIEAYTYLDEHENPLVAQNGATLLGPYVSDSGAVPVFSYKGVAEYYGLKNGLLRLDPEDGAVPTSNLQCVRVDLMKFLNSAPDFGVFMDVGLNPTCHRFRQGYFFKPSAHSDEWYLRTLSGVFGIADGTIIPAPEVVPPKKDEVGGRYSDHEFVSGLTSVTRFPYRRILGANVSQVPVEEARDIVEEELGIRLPEHDELGEIEYERPKYENIGPDSFIVDGFDKITGDSISEPYNWDCGWEAPLVFPDFLAACQWLLKHFLRVDEHVRTYGARTCHGAQHRGSKDPERERAVSDALVDAIKALAIDTLTNGYRPIHSLHLQRIFQDVSAVMELTVVGYLGDGAFYWDESLEYGDQEEDVLEDDVEDEPSEVEELDTRFRDKALKIRERLKSQDHIDLKSRELVRSYLGQALDELQVSSLKILIAALDEFEQIGQKLGYDYAGVNMKLCKVVERELKSRLFESWRKEFRAAEGKTGINRMRDEAVQNGTDQDRNGVKAWKFLDKRQKLEIGPMRFMISTAMEGSQHPAIVSLRDYVNSLDNPSWILSKDCTDALDLISKRYRNGGVHEHLMDHAICVEAMDFILRREKPFLATLLEATKSF